MNIAPPTYVPTENSKRIPANWAVRASLLWQHRKLLARVTVISLVLSLGIAFTIPKQYKSTASIMPPDQQGGGAMMLAALAGGRGGGGLGALGSLASGLLGGHTTTALFVSLLQSGTVRGHIIQRFDLKRIYHSRYNADAAKHLGRVTKISDDKKSGVITIEVEDRDPVRARDIAQAYLDELNKLVTQTSTSSGHRERIFIEHRLDSVRNDLEQAQLELSEFSSKNSTIDIKEQTRAMVEAGARVQAEMLVAQSGLQSLRQIYGDSNIRVKETEARIASLQKDLVQMTGTSAPLRSASSEADGPATSDDDKGSLYPPLRQLPRLAVPYADLYRRVKVQEAVFELLTQQYELARLEEAKDVPVVSVIDAPGVPEKKSFPPRLIVALALTFLAFAATSGTLLFREAWAKLNPNDPRKTLAAEAVPVIRRRIHSIISSRKNAA
ncbi:GumC family protein [Terriglobus saanensis]|uniref:Lipopolysaccharide biosynthesis protein n=1 Tax=Terriglobus saanensis (strain ATCC BAA-1853 / DSM 23119 / SP1PR4) TaxID=401053 RepID=E8V139_TERSS|nr:Wzz/FepE/Etk N-terminal domain-containing protein [Terriglobus saanensis]ADV83387.1 lipopolysaccharide biosynthesis protein [Terriglobus saanensis SP1PR4]